MKCEIHGPYEGPDCQWCVKDALSTDPATQEEMKDQPHERR